MKIYFNEDSATVFNLNTYRLDFLGLENGNPYAIMDFDEFNTAEDEADFVAYIRSLDAVNVITISNEDSEEPLLIQNFQNGKIPSFFKSVDSTLNKVKYNLMIEDVLTEEVESEVEIEHIIE